MKFLAGILADILASFFGFLDTCIIQIDTQTVRLEQLALDKKTYLTCTYSFITCHAYCMIAPLARGIVHVIFYCVPRFNPQLPAVGLYYTTPAEHGTEKYAANLRLKRCK